MFKAVLEPYLQSSIPLADLVVINKIDIASTAEIEASENVVQAYNPGVPIIRVNLNELADRQIELLIR
jgi:G3E family GTPase